MVLQKKIITIETVKIDKIKNKEEINEVSMNFIEFDISNEIYGESNENYDIKSLLKQWENNIIKKHVNYNFKEIPIILPIYINRKNKNSIAKIDIKQFIRFYKNNHTKQNNTSWKIHSIICRSTHGKEHYYSVILNDDVWYLFSNNNIPAMSVIDISNIGISQKIMQECVMIIYEINETNL